MKAISAYDIMKISEIASLGLTQFDMMSCEHDATINKYLYEVGIDISRGVYYNVSYHRTLDKQAKVGLVFSGELRCDRAFLSSQWATAEDRMIAAGVNGDISLARELASMLGAQVEYGSSYSLEDSEDGEYLMEINEIERIEDEMEALGNALLNIRGEQKKRNGAQKKPHEYFEQEPYQKERRKKKNRSTLKHRHLEETK